MSRIELAHISKNYGAVRAVDDVSLSIEPGQFVTLLGPSGSGKTTTMRMIAGLDRPDAGTIAIGSRAMSGPDTFVPTYQRNLGMVFQSYAVWPHMTVQENVAFPLQQRGAARAEQRQRVQRMLDLVGLGRYGGRYPSQLSGGQQQRVSLARALVAEPEVILFDEPLSNLDAKLRDEMRGLLTQLQRQLRVTSVYVTHDQTEAMVLSDRVYIMNGGRLVQGGSPTELYNAPASLFVARFVGSANTFGVKDVDPGSRTVRLDSGDVLNVTAFISDPVERVLIVRPHHVRLAAPDENVNVLEGTVRSAIYLGDRNRYVVDTDNRLEVEVDQVADEGGRAVGERVRLSLPPQHCRLI